MVRLFSEWEDFKCWWSHKWDGDEVDTIEIQTGAFMTFVHEPEWDHRRLLYTIYVLIHINYYSTYSIRPLNELSFGKYLF